MNDSIVIKQWIEQLAYLHGRSGGNDLCTGTALINCIGSLHGCANCPLDMRNKDKVIELASKPIKGGNQDE